MELIKQRVHMNKCNCRNHVQITLSNDFNVPDAKADALSLIKDKGEITIDEVRFVSGKSTVRGKMDFSILYLGDEEGHPVCDLTGAVPFEETVSLDDACQNDEVSVHYTIDDLQTELINSRKIGVKAVITLEFMAESLYDGESAVGVMDDEEVMTRRRFMDVTQMAICKKDTYRFRDEWNLPATKTAIRKILYEDVALMDMETRPMEEKISLSGQVKIFLLYMTEEEDSKLEFYENTLPINGSVECSGCDESMISNIQIGIHSRDLAVKEDEDGERRIIDLELVLNLMMKIYRQEEMEILTDFYSTTRELKPVYTDSYFENLLMKNIGKCRVSGKISWDEGEMPLQIWNVSGTLFVDRKEIVEDGVKISGVIDASVLYVSGREDIPLGSVKGSIPFEQTVEIPGVKPDTLIFLNSLLDQISAVMLADGEIEVKAVVSLDVIAFDRVVMPMISDYTLEELDKSMRNKAPGLIGYVVKEGECLWDIAKQYYTTTESVMELNGLENENVKAGDMLLLAK